MKQKHDSNKAIWKLLVLDKDTWNHINKETKPNSKRGESL